MRRVFVMALLPLGVAPAIAAGDAGQGRTAAQRWCTTCHAAEGAGRGADVAPSFATIAQRRDDEYLRGFLSRPHPPMPRFELSRQDIDDLIAFIRTQRPK